MLAVLGLRLHTSLVSHLVRQGTYTSQDIAIITPYLLQLRKIWKRLSSAFEIVVGDRDLEEMDRQVFRLVVKLKS